MQPSHLDPRDPTAWLVRARSNLARARAGRATPDVLFEDLCFDAQQAAEKALKAVLVKLRVAFPQTHAIAVLIGLIESVGIAVPTALAEAADLTDYAVSTRYPGASEVLDEEEYLCAVAIAERVVRWAEERIRAGSDNPPSSR